MTTRQRAFQQIDVFTSIGCRGNPLAVVPDGEGLSVDTTEDPVTGSLNAALAHWLIGSGRAPSRDVAAQGTMLGRAGRVWIERDDDGTVWVGGASVTCVEGVVRL